MDAKSAKINLHHAKIFRYTVYNNDNMLPALYDPVVPFQRY